MIYHTSVGTDADDLFMSLHAEQLLRQYLSSVDIPAAPHMQDMQDRAQSITKRSGRMLGVVSETMKYMSSLRRSHSAVLLFDSDGILLSMYGNGQVLANLREAGIFPFTQWRLEDMGPNAVTVGLRERIQLYTAGKENSADFLKQYGLYFMPIHMEASPYEWINSLFDTTAFGGIALISLEDQFDPERALILSTILHDFAMTVHSKQVSYGHYETLCSGLIVVNFVERGGQTLPTISFMNSRMISHLALPQEDIMFQEGQSIDASAIIDPLPENQEFWTILHARERVQNCCMTLCILGRSQKYMVDSVPFYQPMLQISGMRFYLTPMEQAACSAAFRAKEERTPFSAIIGQSPKMKLAIQRAALMSHAESNIMIRGESGTGKEVFAKAIHESSLRAGKPFVAVNCGALPRDLVASELFGYAGGAFTGASRQGKAGKFELANGGTIFLDEIGECPLDIQAALLRVVEQKQFMRVGGTELISADVKIISATNADLQGMILQRTFREDLYYRLSTMQIFLPPLREREEDIILLADYFIQKYSNRLGKKQPAVLSPAAKEYLMQCSWRGNVRELQNVIECVISLYDDRVIEPWHIMENIEAYEQPHPAPATVLMHPAAGFPGALTEEDILEALRMCGGNRSAAAKYLGIARKTLYRNMERLGMDRYANKG